jgi:hypothetical protein
MPTCLVAHSYEGTRGANACYQTVSCVGSNYAPEKSYDGNTQATTVDYVAASSNTLVAPGVVALQVDSADP